MLIVVGIMLVQLVFNRPQCRQKIRLRTNKRCQILLNVWYRGAEPAAK